MLKEFGLDLGLELVRIDLPFRLNHVNCYLAEGENGFTVIDAGLHNETTINRWEKELAGKDVTDLIITHYHPDHYGYAGAFQKKYRSRVSMSKIDAQHGAVSWESNVLDRLQADYQSCGIPEDLSLAMADNTKEFIPRVTPYPEVNHYLEEGQKIPIGKYEYEVIFTPGHSDGLVTFYNKEKNILLSTDHILPRITPNISYWFHGDPNPLARYYESLEKIAQLEVDLVIPSHGSPFYNGHERVLELKAHHDERLEELLDILRVEQTIFAATEELFQMKLTIHESRFAIGETIAHLEYLRLNGHCKREVINGVYLYKKE